MGSALQPITPRGVEQVHSNCPDGGRVKFVSDRDLLITDDTSGQGKTNKATSGTARRT